ncbi:MAG: HAD family hydrolase, partial [Caldimonas sp.]
MIEIGPIGAIAFDLDGTLVDSAPDIAAALDSALEEEGLRRFDATTVQRWIGDGPDVLIGRALDTQGLVDAPAELRTRLRRRFDAYTLGAPLERGTVFSGVVDLLEQLHARLPMVVITNKPSALARVVVEAA